MDFISLFSGSTIVATTTLHLLFVGDIFLDRHIDTLTLADNKKIERENLTRKPGLPLFTYPFQGLKTLEREKYDAWIGNLECPVTDKQSSKKDKEVYLRFSCRPEYLKELSKYFSVVSLANNHTDNMGESAFTETKKHLDEAGIKYFGSFDQHKDEICKVVELKNKENTSIPIAFCGYNGVYKLPTQKEIAEIKKYSGQYITIVYPHQGEEYTFKGNTYQKLIYRKFIDAGADVVIGSHPHVIENVEIYKNKYIFYSLGNFIFDQNWSKTRKHMELDTKINIFNFDKSTTTKPKFEIKFTPIFTHSDKDFITKKWEMGEKEYQNKLRQIGFKNLPI